MNGDDAETLERPTGSERPAFMGPEAPVNTRRNRRRFPRWAPWPIVAAFAVGIGIGAGGTLLLTGGGSGNPPAPGTAAGPNGPPVATITIPEADSNDPDAYGAVSVEGDVLPRLAGQADAAVGLTAPVLHGADFDGNQVSITDDGRAKIIVFLAHWCPYCRNEVPVVRDWYASGAVPAGVDVYSVSTLTDPARGSYPPRTWLAAEGWNVPLIVDDARDTAAGAFGLHAVPFWVLVDADGIVVARGAGAISADGLTAMAVQLAGGGGAGS